MKYNRGDLNSTKKAMDGKKILVGDKVKTKCGRWYTVQMVYDNAVYVYETQNVIHARNIVEKRS